MLHVLFKIIFYTAFQLDGFTKRLENKISYRLKVMNKINAIIGKAIAQNSLKHILQHKPFISFSNSQYGSICGYFYLEIGAMRRQDGAFFKSEENLQFEENNLNSKTDEQKSLRAEAPQLKESSVYTFKKQMSSAWPL